MGVDASAEMLARAAAQNLRGEPEAFPDRIGDKHVGATDERFGRDPAGCLATAMYPCHDAPGEEDVSRMCRFVARNPRPGGLFALGRARSSWRRQVPNVMGRVPGTGASLSRSILEIPLTR